MKKKIEVFYRMNFVFRYCIRGLFVVLCLFCFIDPVFADQDTLTITHLNKQSASTIRSNPDTAFYYASKSIELARKANYKQGLAEALVLAGHVNYFNGKTNDAIRNFDEAIDIYKKLNNDNGLTACYIQYGRMYNQLADYNKAMVYLNLAFEISKKSKNDYSLADALKNIGIVYFDEGLLSKALDYYYKGLFIAVKHHYSILSAELYNDIGAVQQNMEVYPNALEYFKKSLSIFEGTNELQALGILNQNIGEVFLAQAQYDEAIAYFKKANAIVKKQNDKDGLSSVYTDLGVCYAHKKQFQKAISYLDTSLAIGKRYKIVYNQAYAEIGFATVYNIQKDYQKAYPHALAAHQLAVKLGNLSIKANAALQLNETLAGLGRVEEAYTSLKEYINLKNGLKDNESIQKLTSYNYNLQFSVRERLLAQEQRNKEQLYKQTVRVQRLTILVFFILVIAMLGTTLIYYSERGKQLKINASLDEQTSKLNDLNKLKDRLIAILAHDLRGPLSTLRGLFDLLQDKTISHEEMLSMLPLVLKKLEHTSDFLDTLLFWINSQMENFESAAKSFSVNEVVVNEVKQHYEQAISKGIIITEHMALGLTAFADPNCVCIVVRNLITNAIKFCEAGDTIQIAAKQQDHHILISVNDSGGGMTTEQVNKLFRSKVDSQPGTQNERGTGMGLLFCKDLVEKANGKIWVKSEVGIGSKFSFTIPST